MRISDWSSDVCSSDLRSNASQADIRELLLALLLVALEESPMRANDEDLAKLSNAVSCAGSHFGIEHDRTRNLCLAIAAISKNVALQLFVQLLLTSVTPNKTTEAAATDSSDALNALYAAVRKIGREHICTPV